MLTRCRLWQVDTIPKPLVVKALQYIQASEKVISIGYTLPDCDVEDMPEGMPETGQFAAYVLRNKARWKEVKPSLIERYEQARVGEMPNRCEGRAQQTKAELFEKVCEVCQALHKVLTKCP